MQPVPFISDLSERLGALRDRLEIVPFEWAASAPLLTAPQFTGDDVIAVTDLTASQLHNWVSRDWGFRLSQGNPGKGKRRLFSGNDIIALSLAESLSPFNLVKVASQFIRTNQISGRAALLLTDPTIRPDYGIFIWRDAGARADAETPWAYTPFGSPDADKIGFAVVSLNLDGLIIETLERLAFIIEGLPVPAKDRLTAPTPEETAKATADFFGIHDTDEAGRPVLTGLTVEESHEFVLLESTPWRERSGEQQERFDDLEAVHFEASHKKSLGKLRAK